MANWWFGCHIMRVYGINNAILKHGILTFKNGMLVSREEIPKDYYDGHVIWVYPCLNEPAPHRKRGCYAELRKACDLWE